MDQKQHALKNVRQSLDTLKMWERDLHLAVQIAREKGATWEEIGETLGVTRQAAHERFGKTR